jgi:hypothetical protein
MAKFLPFVVEKSTPLHTFQTIVSRSKGMNQIAIASIFWLIMDKGISYVRQIATELPEMPLDKLYDQIINACPTYLIPNADFKAFGSMGKFIDKYAKDKISAELHEYEMSDIMSFLLAMHYMKKLPDYTSLRLEDLLNGKAFAAEIELDKYKLFSNEGAICYFKNREQISAYIQFHAVIFNDKEHKQVRAAISFDETHYDNATRAPAAPPSPKKPTSAKKNTRFDAGSANEPRRENPMPPWESK